MKNINLQSGASVIFYDYIVNLHGKDLKATFVWPNFDSEVGNVSFRGTFLKNFFLLSFFPLGHRKRHI